MTEGKPNYDPEGVNADIRQQLRDQSRKQAAVKELARRIHNNSSVWGTPEIERELVALIARHEAAPAVNQELKEALREGKEFVERALDPGLRVWPSREDVTKWVLRAERALSEEETKA